MHREATLIRGRRPNTGGGEAALTVFPPWHHV